MVDQTTKNQEILLQLLDSALPNREKLEQDLETFWSEKMGDKNGQLDVGG